MSVSSSVDDPPGKPSAVAEIGRSLLDAAIAPVRAVLTYFGDHAILLGQAMSGLVRKPFRLRLFLEFAPQQEVREVPDPYYGGPNGFEEVLDLVEAAARGLLAHLRQRARAA